MQLLTFWLLLVLTHPVTQQWWHYGQRNVCTKGTDHDSPRLAPPSIPTRPQAPRAAPRAASLAGPGKSCSGEQGQEGWQRLKEAQPPAPAPSPQPQLTFMCNPKGFVHVRAHAKHHHHAAQGVQRVEQGLAGLQVLGVPSSSSTVGIETVGGKGEREGGREGVRRGEGVKGSRCVSS